MSSPEQRFIERVSNKELTLYKPHATTTAKVEVTKSVCFFEPLDGHLKFKVHIPEYVEAYRSWLIDIDGDEYRIEKVSDNAGLNRITRFEIERRDSVGLTIQSPNHNRATSGMMTRTWTNRASRFGFVVPSMVELPDPPQSMVDTMIYIPIEPDLAYEVTPNCQIDRNTLEDWQVIAVDRDVIKCRRVV